MKPEDNARLRDILQAALLVEQYVNAMDYEKFELDVKTQDAVLRRLEIMGEAASRISEETREQFPNIPFHQLRGMRNILIHDYGSVNLARVWASIRNDLPALVTILKPLFPLL